MKTEKNILIAFICLVLLVGFFTYISNCCYEKCGICDLCKKFNKYLTEGMLFKRINPDDKDLMIDLIDVVDIIVFTYIST